jgi:hypothetical protein
MHLDARIHGLHIIRDETGDIVTPLECCPAAVPAVQLLLLLLLLRLLLLLLLRIIVVLQ